MKTDRVVIEVFMERTANGPPKAIIQCRPNFAYIPPGEVRTMVEAMLAATVTAPGWRQTRDIRLPFKFPNPTP